jgi:hypothetical protein
VGSSDKYGCDLALSVHGGSFHKIAFFQFKTVEDGEGKIKRKQINQIVGSPVPSPMLWVLAAEKKRFHFTLEEPSVIAALPGGSEINFDTSTWIQLDRWLNSWLSCQIGAASRGDVDRAEAELRRFVDFTVASEQVREIPSWLPEVWLRIDVAGHGEGS